MKFGLNVQDHAIIYTGPWPSPLLGGEQSLQKEPILVIPTDPRESLDVASRINFGKVYTVEHNLKVKDVGQISPTSLPKVIGYYNDMSVAD